MVPAALPLDCAKAGPAGSISASAAPDATAAKAINNLLILSLLILPSCVGALAHVKSPLHVEDGADRLQETSPPLLTVESVNEVPLAALLPGSQQNNLSTNKEACKTAKFTGRQR
jgi:hypothetical protein